MNIVSSSFIFFSFHSALFIAPLLLLIIKLEAAEQQQQQQQQQQEEGQCFEQQYSNRVANFGSLHIVKRVGVISPLGAFYLAHFIDEADEEEASRTAGEEERNLVRRSNGEKLVIYSGHSAHSLEWAQLELFTSTLRLEPILGDHQHSASSPSSASSISPVLLVTACAIKARPVALSGSSFSVRPDQLGIVPAYENELLINFRTFENGLFFYSMADAGDHLIVQLSGGRVEVFFDFGAHQRILLNGGVALDDGSWHELRWLHRFDSAELFVDGVRVNGTEIVGLYRKLDLHYEVEIGGRPEEMADDQQAVEFRLQHGFHGCLARLELNGADLLAAAPNELKSCQMARPQLVSLGPGTSLQIPYSFLPFALDFHVLVSRPGPLLTILDQTNSTLLQARLLEGLQVGVGTGLAGETPKIVSLGPHANGWHSLAIKLRAESLDLELDGSPVFWVQGHQARRIGTTMQTFLLSALGCYRSTTVDLNQGTPIGADFSRDQCPLVERCWPNPCRNEGKCVQTGFNSFQCQCQRNYTGRFCQISKLPHSCEQHFFASSLKSTKMSTKMAGGGGERVLIDLDGGGPLKPFAVECRRRAGGKGKKRKDKEQQLQKEELSTLTGSSTSNNDNVNHVLTILRNDVPKSGVVVKGITEPGAVRRVLDYGLGADELERLMAAFEHCEQRMRFFCSDGQRLMTYRGENRPSSWYATRNGQHGLQWGDAPPFSRMCPCAMNDSCVEQNRQCNCDSGRAAALDEGVNPHMQLLPVLQLFIGGGTEIHSMANVSVGPLECTGRYVFDAITFTDRNQRLLTSLSFPWAASFHASVTLRLAHAQLTVFTYTSSNHERWYQLFVRGGRLVGQVVYAGVSHELVSDVAVNDNRWHVIHWEVDEQSQRLQVDRAEKTVFVACVPPRASTLIVGSRTGKDRSGFAGQLRNLVLNGEEVNLAQLAQRTLGQAGIQLAEWNACEAAEQQNSCRNEGQCVELYDGFKCNCSRTPFTGENCDDEVGMWVPLGSELKIAWQHPAQVSNCFRMNIQSASAPVSLIRAKALFAESHFDLSVDRNGHLNMFIFDGFFFTQNATFDGIFLADNRSKDIRFCANSTLFLLTVNGEKAISVEGNFTFFTSLNVWHFVDRAFSGCISRLMVGDAFPLKSPRDSRLMHTGKIRFGSCPYDNLFVEHRRPDKGPKDGEGQQGGGYGADGGTSAGEIHASSFVKSQRRLLFITPAIGLLSAICILLSLCVFLLYVQRRPDGVYKTHEKNGGCLATAGGHYSGVGVPPLLLLEGQTAANSSCNSRPLRVAPKHHQHHHPPSNNQKQQHHPLKLLAKSEAQQQQQEKFLLPSADTNKEYFC